jgi:cell division protein FtsX
MGLLGSPGWVVRGPFVVEGGITGVVAGTAAGLAVAVCFAGLDMTWPATVSQLLPGIDLAVIERLTLALPVAGVAIGSASAAFGLRGLRSR